MKYIMLFTNEHGRETYQRTDEPERQLAIRVAEKLMTPKQAADVVVLEVAPKALDKALLNAQIAFHRQVELARHNPEPIRQAILEKKMTPEQLETLRAELQHRFGYAPDDYAPPWPFNELRDE